jgi:capsular polysaccharide biosynthesis protein
LNGVDRAGWLDLVGPGGVEIVTADRRQGRPAIMDYLPDSGRPTAILSMLASFADILGPPDTWRNALDLAAFAPIVRRSLWLIVMIAIVAAGAAFLLSENLPKVYQSEARVLVGSLTETSTDQLDAYQRLAQTYAELATSTPLLNRVIGRLSLGDDPRRLADRIDILPSGGGVIRIVASAASPEEAAQIANAIADEITLLAKPPAAGSTSLAAVFQPAVAADVPAGPRVLLNTVIAALLGPVVALGFVLLFATIRGAPRSSTQPVGDQGSVSVS